MNDYIPNVYSPNGGCVHCFGDDYEKPTYATTSTILPKEIKYEEVAQECIWCKRKYTKQIIREIIW